jgi:hypothetical protein
MNPVTRRRRGNKLSFVVEIVLIRHLPDKPALLSGRPSCLATCQSEE